LRQLEVNQISISYGSIPAVWDASIGVNSGEIVSLIGANGAGKSSLLKSIMGIVPPRSGDITFNGASLKGLRPHSVVARGISYVPEGRRLFPNMSVKENIRLGAPRSCSDIESRFDRIFSLFPILKERQKQESNTLSGGEQQMVAIGRAMMSNPKLLLLDELSFGLSPLMFERAISAIGLIRESGVSILMAEQNSERALEVSDRTYVMENGRIEMSGKSEELINNDGIRAAYLGVVD